ncbi:hypothetical protein ACK1YH_004353 [Salmonella enterica]
MITLDERTDVLHNVVVTATKLSRNNFSAYNWLAFNNLNQVFHGVYLSFEMNRCRTGSQPTEARQH